jgi:hypothetical protein
LLIVSIESVTLVFELTVDDGLGGQSSDTVAITILDTNAPPARDLAVASEQALWPPNHKMKAIQLVGVTDPENANIVVTILGVTQDEPINGLGDGDTAPDAIIQGDSALIRAERAGGGNGRVYQIEFEADDGAGGVCTGFVTVCVPHSKANGSQCADDGQTFNSVGP